jgi:hypothetical protein
MRLTPQGSEDSRDDALIDLTAARAGRPVLTAGRDGFDLIRQLAREGRFIRC